MYGRAAQEGFAVAAALGIGVAEEHRQTVLGWPDRLEPGSTTSLQRDTTEGLPSELEEQIGVIVRRGRETGVDVTTLAFVHDSLLPGERRARGVIGGD